jgi:peptide/nickel transport system substrate-binding protein
VGIERPQDADGTSKLWFPETRHTLSGKLLEYWWRYGGLAQFGYPLSEPFEETSRADSKRYTVQYFERARMELHPEKPAPYEVELGLLGVEQVGMRAVPAEELPVAPKQGVQTTKDSITIGSSQEPADLTIFNNASITARIRSLIDDGLVARDDDGNLFPLIAWYVPTLENGGAKFVGMGEDRHLQVKHKLRQGIEWSDGKEVTSGDVIFAFRLIMNPDAPVVSRSEYQKLQNVDNPDRYTVLFRYRSSRQVRAYYDSLPDPEDYDFLKPFVDLNKPVVSPNYSEIGLLLPEHVLSAIPPQEIWEHEPYARSPVGTGAWKVERWVDGVEMVLVPNGHYTLTAPPPIKRITIKFQPDVRRLEDAAVRGELDLILSEAYLVPPDRTDLFEAGFKTMSRPGHIWEHLTMSFNYGPFKERAVREAMILAINRQQIVDVVFRGTGRVANGVVPSANSNSLSRDGFALNSREVASRYKLPTYPYDPERAASLLEEAGWKLGPDGIRSKNGVKLKFYYGATTFGPRPRIQAQVSTDLRVVGIEADVRSWPSPCFHCLYPSLLPWGDLAMEEFAWVYSVGADFDVWTCAEAYDRMTNSGQNEQHYCTQALDAANTRFKTEIGLEAHMANAEAQVILMQDIALIPLVERPIIELVNVKLQNYRLANGTSGEHTYASSLWNARQWYFK